MKIIVVLGTIALSGILIMQFLWINSAVQLSYRQNIDRVQTTLQSCINTLFTSHTDADCCTIYDDSCHVSDTRKLIPFSDEVIDSVLHTAFSAYSNADVLVWAIVNIDNGSIVVDNFNENTVIEKKLLKEGQAAHLSCFTHCQKLAIFVYLPVATFFSSRIILSVATTFAFLILLMLLFIIMIKAWKRQKQLSEMKTEVINNISHELKTPVAAIKLAAEIIVRDEVKNDSEKVTRYAEMISDENQRLQKQIDNVMKVAIQNYDDYKFNIELCDIHEILSNLVINFELAQILPQNHIVFEAKAAKFLIETDAIYLVNIVRNLIDNAIKYGGSDVFIKVTTRNDEKFLYIEVADNGPGIPSKYHKQVFEQFFRVPTGNRHDAKGSGLGLYFVKRFIEALGGGVVLKSNINNGTSFELFIPFVVVTSKRIV